MKNIRFVLIALLIITAISCKKDSDLNTVSNITQSLNDVFNDYNIDVFDYIVATYNDNPVIKSHYGNKNHNEINQNIVENYSYPIALKILINEGIVNGNAKINIVKSPILINNLFSCDYCTYNLYNENFLPAYKNIIIAHLHDDIRNKYKKYFKTFVTKETEGNITTKGFLKQMAKISGTFQLPEISGFINDTVISNPNISGYLQNKYLYAGWRVFIFNQQVIFWDYIETGDKTILLLNMMNQGIFVGIVYPEGIISSPFDENREDLLQCPLVSHIIHKIYLSAFDINPKNLETVSWKDKNIIKNSTYGFLFSKELWAFGHSYLKSGDKIRSKKLFDLHDSLFPNNIPSKYLNENSLACFEYVTDSFKGEKVFEIEQDTFVRLFTSGQVAKEIWGSNNLWGRDYVEIKIKSKKNDQINRLRLYYNYPNLNANKTKKVLFPFIFNDIDDENYLVEMKIPWDSIDIDLDKSRPIQVLFTINDSDSDPKSSESRLANAHEMMDFQLLGENIRPLKDRPYAIKTINAPIIDGKIDDLWATLEYQGLNSLIEGEVESERDNSGSFKAMWDNKNLYLLFKVCDQAKQYPWYITKDYCYIKNKETGHLVWQVSGEKTLLFPYYVTNQKFWLEKGRYILEYKSDELFSFSNWFEKMPPFDFYGAYLFINK